MHTINSSCREGGAAPCPHTPSRTLRKPRQSEVAKAIHLIHSKPELPSMPTAVKNRHVLPMGPRLLTLPGSQGHSVPAPQATTLTQGGQVLMKERWCPNPSLLRSTVHLQVNQAVPHAACWILKD